MKTTRKQVFSTTIGKFTAYHIQYHCPAHPDLGSFKSDELQHIVPTGCNFAYDAIVEIGYLRYFHHYQLEEIKDIFKENYDLTISSSEIENLEIKFITYLSIVHENSTLLLQQYIKSQGGYILHVDTTCEGDSPKLASSIDSISGFILHSAKLKSENEHEIKIFLTEIKKKFGIPLAVMSDMSQGIRKGVIDIFGDIAHYICHYHFLEMISTLLFKAENAELRKRLSRYGISGTLKSLKRKLEKSFENDNIEINHDLLNTMSNNKDKNYFKFLAYYLTLWILDYVVEQDGHFDQNYLLFLHRINKALLYIDEAVKLFPYDCSETGILWKLRNRLHPIVNDKTIVSTVKIYKKKLQIFNELRTALCLKPRKMKYKFSDYGIIHSYNELKSIKESMNKFKTNIENRLNGEKNKNFTSSLKLIRNRLEKYNDMLYADPIEVNVGKNKCLIFIHRTNNIIERHFRFFSHNHRRTSGKNSIKNKIKSMHPSTPLVLNLKNRNYVKLVFGNDFNIANKFAEVDEQIVKQKLNQVKKCKQKYASFKIKKIIRCDNYFNKINQIFNLNIDVALL